MKAEVYAQVRENQLKYVENDVINLNFICFS